MADVERLSLLYKVAFLYYEKRLKKYEIARKIKQSPTQVGLLLNEAIKTGIVKIEVALPHFTVLQESLKTQFGLQDAIVIPYDRDASILRGNLSKATAEYFEKNVRDGCKVAVGGGYLTYRMIEMLKDKDRDIDIYPTAVIGRGSALTHIDPIVLVTLLWAKSGQQYGKGHYVTITPPDVKASYSEIKKYYVKLKMHEKLQILLKEMECVDFVFTSIGSLGLEKEYLSATKKQSQSILKELKISKEKLEKEGVVGDIAYSFFDKEGNNKPEWSIFPAIEIEKLKEIARDNMKRVVVTVGGYKMDSLKAAIKGGLCNVLITDSSAASELLRQIQ